MVESQGRRKDTWVKAVRHYMAAKAALKRRTALGPGPAMPPIPPEMPPDQSPVDMPPVVDDPPGVPPPAPVHDPPSMPPSSNAKVIKALAKRMR